MRWHDMKMWYFTLVLILLGLLSQAGCSLPALQSSSPSIAIYLLDVKVDDLPAVKPNGKVLLVSLPKAQSGYETRSIVYTKTPLTLSYFGRSEWADTPANMLAPLIVNTMEKSGAFRAVLTAPGQNTGDLRLDTDIIRLQHEFFQQPSQVRFTLRAKLFDAKTREVLATRLFEAVEPAPSENAYGGVQAANRVVKRVLEKQMLFVIDALTRTRFSGFSGR